jgi:hypothetical protein
VLVDQVPVPTDRGLTFYVRNGEVFSEICAAITLTAILTLVVVRKIRQREVLSPSDAVGTSPV